MGKMKYIAAAVTGAMTFFALVYLSTLVEMTARGYLDWGILYSAPNISLWNGGWGLVAAVGAFWLTLDWRRKADATRQRKRIAARARA
jgi:hypothetical protein